jgi:hypothetical protein
VELRQVQSAFLALRQDGLAKNVLMTAQKCLGNNPSIIDLGVDKVRSLC